MVQMPPLRRRTAETKVMINILTSFLLIIVYKSKYSYIIPSHILIMTSSLSCVDVVVVDVFDDMESFENQHSHDD